MGCAADFARALCDAAEPWEAAAAAIRAAGLELRPRPPAAPRPPGLGGGAVFAVRVPDDGRDPALRPGLRRAGSLRHLLELCPDAAGSAPALPVAEALDDLAEAAGRLAGEGPGKEQRFLFQTAGGGGSGGADGVRAGVPVGLPGGAPRLRRRGGPVGRPAVPVGHLLYQDQ